MAAKTLQQAIFNAFEKDETMMTAKLMGHLLGELRDFFAHEAMKVGNPIGTNFQKSFDYKDQEAIIKFFNNVFKDVSAFKKMED